MNVFTRGIRNAFRNATRTFSIVTILGLSIGLSLTMLIANKAVGNKINSVKSSIGNTISISPAGIQGFDGGGNPLTQASVDKLKTLAHITNISESVSDRLTNGTTTSLVSSITPGSLGQRFGREGGFSGGGFSQNIGGNTQTPSFTPPINASGTTNTTQLNGTTLKIISGNQIDGTKDATTALVGKNLATKNNLSVGSTFTMYGTTISVAGIFDTGTAFSNNAVILPLPTLQKLSTQTGNLTSATASVDSISNIDTVTSAVKATLGTSADVTNSKTTAQNAIQPLDNVKSISLFSLVGAIGAGAVIILLTMVMIVRERKREIGVIKAIGGSNIRIMAEFMIEALTLTLLGAFIGLMIGVIGGQPVTKLLVTNSASNSSQNTTGPGPGQGGGGFGRGLRNNSAIRGINSIKTQVGWGIILDGFGAAVLISLIGSALAAGMISKVRPSEVMRTA